MITSELQADVTRPKPRQTHVLRLVGVAPSSWHRAPHEGERKRPGPAPRPIAEEVAQAVITMATDNPWYGYKRIAVMCRRDGRAVTDRQTYRVMKDHGLLKQKRTRRAEAHQAAKLFELLPQGPNDLWQMDVTYVHIPGFGWWYAVTVIDYYSRYLLACHLTPSYSVIDVIHALKLAREEAERMHGPFGEAAVSGDRQRLVVHRQAVCGLRAARFFARADPVPHAAATGPPGAVPPDAQGGRGVLAAVRQPAARAGVPGRIPRALQPAAPALGAHAGRRRRRAHAGRRVPAGAGDPDAALAELGPRGAGKAGGDDDRRVGLRATFRPPPCERPGALIAAPWTPG